MASRQRAKMPISDRAKQFSPFAALRGLDAAMERKRRELGLEEPRELSEYEEDALNHAFSKLSYGTKVAVIHYENGTYVTSSGILSRSDPATRLLHVGEKKIPFTDIREILIGETNTDGTISFPGKETTET